MKEAFEDMKLYIRGWMNYYGIANMGKHMIKLDEHIRHRIRQFIWLQWKKPRTRYRMLVKLKAPIDQAFMAAYSSRGKWFNSNLSAVKCALPNKMLANLGYYEVSSAYQHVRGKC
ncbi:MAG: hypothetical protein LUE27_04545 [Clostridia bacterium]|nr:hypothetical protein [Clostridia bacterium]